LILNLNFPCTEPKSKLVEDAVSDGLQQIYGSDKETGLSETQDTDPTDRDALTYHLPLVIFDVEADRRRWLENVDASDADGVWVKPEDHRGASRANCSRKRRRRSNFVTDPQMDLEASKDDRRRCSRCGACFKGFLTFLFSTVGLTFLLIGRVVPDSGSGKSGHFCRNPAKSGSGQFSGRIWQTPVQLQ